MIYIVIGNSRAGKTMLGTALATYLGCKYVQCSHRAEAELLAPSILKEPNVVVECYPSAWFAISAEARAINKSYKIIKLACSYAAYLRRFPRSDVEFYETARIMQQVKANCNVGTSRRSTDAVLDYIVEQLKI